MAEKKFSLADLTDDQIAVASRVIREAGSALGMVQGMFNKDAPGGEIEQRSELVPLAVRKATRHVIELAEALGIPSEEAEAVTRRHAAIRKANIRIRGLERQLGESVTPDKVQQAVKSYVKRIKRWWDIHGFGHVSSFVFEEHIVRVSLSCLPFGDFPLIDSKTPVSDKERKTLWRKSLEDRGFVLAEEEKGSFDFNVVDCDQTREAIARTIKEAFPTSRIISFENHSAYTPTFPDGRLHLNIKDVNIIIYSLSEIAALPLPEEEME
ncbi:hypothetical protein AA14337_3358 [Acetobacter malorum DSM 14337]|uniref:Uncharacterized protein n=1 Tax=Acetobacter malorum DSM 14337 TaxID=1307910 RepID=A0ABQ0Q144_9PROT|nr:hypothetical protein [Acetobacter malorum]KXV06504.1 hypothetical protein AD930_07855 [Acetobacter malorum]GBQ86574.1 hypothetical protein AA14337_3358 [Acetobacter malorum DSM 14337]